MNYICTKKCYRNNRLYRPGDVWEGDGNRIPKEFVEEGKRSASSKKPNVGKDRKVVRSGENAYAEEKSKAKEALGHTTEQVSPRKDAADPFGNMYEKRSEPGNFDNFLD